MMKSIIKIAWLFFVFLALFSCRTEETLVALNPSQSKEYINKSLWKEDEVFIKNVKKVYDDNGMKLKWNLAVEKYIGLRNFSKYFR